MQIQCKKQKHDSSYSLFPLICLCLSVCLSVRLLVTIFFLEFRSKEKPSNGHYENTAFGWIWFLILKIAVGTREGGGHLTIWQLKLNVNASRVGWRSKGSKKIRTNEKKDLHETQPKILKCHALYAYSYNNNRLPT